MKKSISLIALAIFTAVLAGCSKPSSTISTRPAIELVQAGKDIEFPGGYVLHVAKREGSSLEGVRILVTPPNGQASEITAERGTIKPGTPENPNFENQITMTLHNAKTVTGSKHSTAPTMVIVLYQPIFSTSPSQEPLERLRQAREREATNSTLDPAVQQVQDRLQQMRQREATNNTPSSHN